MGNEKGAGLESYDSSPNVLGMDRQPYVGRGPLPPGDGGSTLDGMNAWQQTVETRLGEMRQDIRDVGKKVDSHFVLTWGGLIIGFLGMAGLMAKGFGWL